MKKWIPAFAGMTNTKLYEKISIVGFGRFGKVLYRLVKDDFVVTVYTRKPINSGTEISPNTVLTNSIQDIYKSDVIFFAVPIDAFESVIKAHKKILYTGTPSY